MNGTGMVMLGAGGGDVNEMMTDDVLSNWRAYGKEIVMNVLVGRQPC